MNEPSSPASPDLDRVAAELTEAVAAWDESAIRVDDSGASAAVLDRVGHELAARGVRCVQVHVPASGELGSRGLVAQVLGRTDPDALTDADLQACFFALTEPGEGYDRVALLVADAHGLLPSALRYLQVVCHSGPKLRVVLAGRSGLAASLAADEFADLRGRITRRPGPPPPAVAAPPSPAPPAPEGRASAAAPPSPPVPERRVPAEAGDRRRVGPLVLAGLGLGLGAAAAFVAWMARPGDAPAPPVAARTDVPAPDGRGASGERTGTEATPAVETARREDAPDSPRAPDPASRVDPSAAGAAPLAAAVTPDPSGPVAPAPPAPVPAPEPTAALGDAPPARDAAREPAREAAVPAGRDEAPAPDVAVARVAPPVEATTLVRPDEVSPPHDAPTPAAEAAAPTPEPSASAAVPGEAPGAAASGDPVGAPARGEARPESPGGAATARAEPPEVAQGQEHDADPARGAGTVVAHTPSPVAPSPPEPAPAAGPALPPPLPPPPYRAPVVAVAPPSPQAIRPERRFEGGDAAEGGEAPHGRNELPPEEARPPKGGPGQAAPNSARRARGGAEQDSAAAPPSPQTIARGDVSDGRQTAAPRPDERRCRAIVLKAQLGEPLSDADMGFLRGGCRAR